MASLQNRLRSAVFVASLVPTCVGVAFADPVVILASSGGVWADAHLSVFQGNELPSLNHSVTTQQICCSALTGSFSHTVTALAQIDQAFASVVATQSTTIAPDGSRWFGSGSVESSWSSTGVNTEIEQQGWNSFLIVFSVLEPVYYRLQAGFSDVGAGESFLSLGTLVLYSFMPGSESVVLQGRLAPGLYDFRAHGDVFFSPGPKTGTTRYSFDFAVEPVPEPATLLLTAVGTTLLGLRRHRSNGNRPGRR